MCLWQAALACQSMPAYAASPLHSLPSHVTRRLTSLTSAVVAQQPPPARQGIDKRMIGGMCRGMGRNWLPPVEWSWHQILNGGCGAARGAYLRLQHIAAATCGLGGVPRPPFGPPSPAAPLRRAPCAAQASGHRGCPCSPRPPSPCASVPAGGRSRAGCRGSAGGNGAAGARHEARLNQQAGAAASTDVPPLLPERPCSGAEAGGGARRRPSRSTGAPRASRGGGQPGRRTMVGVELAGREPSGVGSAHALVCATRRRVAGDQGTGREKSRKDSKAPPARPASFFPFQPAARALLGEIGVA